MYEYLTRLNRKSKIIFILCVDLLIVTVSLYVAFILRLNDTWPIEPFVKSINVLYVMIVSTIIIILLLKFHLKKLSRFYFNFETVTDMVALVASVTITGFSINIIFEMGAPRTVPIIAGAVMLILIFSFRFLAWHLLRSLELSTYNRTAVAIYGAGGAGCQLASLLRNSEHYRPVCFVDENSNLQGLNISGLYVYKPSQLEKLITKGKVKEVFLAIPSLNQIARDKIIKSIGNLGCKMQEVPAYDEIIKSKNLVKSLRPVKANDILNRDNIEIDIVASDYENANILVTGGGGSIGSELCRKIILTKPRRLVILDISEFNLYNIERELRKTVTNNEIELVPILGSVCDVSLLEIIFKEHNINIILHSAAYKHVPLVEQNIIEAIKNNVLGTKIIAETAAKNNADRFTLVSSDKAVRPTSVMGATKRIAELVLQDIQQSDTQCIYTMVRFGNVIGSSGSVIPLFKQQIEEGGPVIVTHQDITRYFMTIPEASQLVLLASSFAEGGEVFVLDMGEPIKIIELARRMIKLSGYTVADDENPDGDIEIKISRLRPGEKLYEELIVGDNVTSTYHPSIFQSKESKLSKHNMEEFYKQIEKCIKKQDSIKARDLIFDLVKLVDKIY